MGKLGYGASFFEATEDHYSGWFRRMGPANRTGMYTLAWRICEDGGGTGRCGARWDMVNVHGNKAGMDFVLVYLGSKVARMASRMHVSRLGERGWCEGEQLTRAADGTDACWNITVVEHQMERKPIGQDLIKSYREERDWIYCFGYEC
jgi:hypothetical protein